MSPISPKMITRSGLQNTNRSGHLPVLLPQISRLSIAAACWGLIGAQSLPLEPAHNSGQSITGAFEGWFANSDGSFSLLIGYYNRNLKQALDIPAGPDNRIDPGGPDRGQPTHFLSGRQWGVFTVTVPK